MRYVSVANGLAFVSALVFFLANNSFGQPVSVERANGVHIRAPFVSVDIFPRGGVSVRAPYAAVDVVGRPRYITRSVAPIAAPAPQALAAMDEDSLWQRLQTASSDLNQQLNRFDTGPHWRQYLRSPHPVIGGSSDDINNRHAAIIQLLQRFNDVSANPQYSKLSSLNSFTTMRAVLSELTSRQGNVTLPMSAPEELPPPK